MVRRGREADHDHTGERQRAAEQQVRCGALFQEDRGQCDDDDRRDEDEHRGGARVDPLLGIVEDDVVDAEPEQPGEEQQRQLPACGTDIRACRLQAAEQHAAHEQSS